MARRNNGFLRVSGGWVFRTLLTERVHELQRRLGAANPALTDVVSLERELRQVRKELEKLTSLKDLVRSNLGQRNKRLMQLMATVAVTTRGRG